MTSNIYDARDFGARGDGHADDTAALRAAIATCASCGNGGRVDFPPGVYLSGPLELCNGLEMHLHKGARVQFSRDFDDYPLVRSSYEGRETICCQSPLWGEGLTGIRLTGEGTFDGGGDAWRPVKRWKLSPAAWEALVASGGVVDPDRDIWWPTAAAWRGEALVRDWRESGLPLTPEAYAEGRDYLRPNLLKLTRCRQVTLDGPTFQNSPAWNIHLLFCERVQVNNIRVLNPSHAQNGDGLDIESCRYVDVTGCHLDVGDDAICLKSGRDEEGRRRNLPCEHIVIKDCTVLHGHGGIVVGSEMSGGVRDVQVSNCSFQGTEVGLRFKTARGRGGTVQGIRIRDITMSNIEGAAISFDMYYENKSWHDNPRLPVSSAPVGPETPHFRDVHIQGVCCHDARVAIEMHGLPEMPVEGVTLEDVFIKSERGVVLNHVRALTLHAVKIAVRRAPVLELTNVSEVCFIDFEGEIEPEASKTPLTPGTQAALLQQSSLGPARDAGWILA